MTENLLYSRRKTRNCLRIEYENASSFIRKVAESGRPEKEMKRNGAIWVALVVVAIAAAVMYFVVLPQAGGKKAIDELAQKAGATMDKASDTMQKTIDQVAGQAQQTTEKAKTEAIQKAADPKAVLLQKMARIKSDGETAANELDALFYYNKHPTAEQIAAARAKLAAALKNASDLTVPAGMDDATMAMVANISKGAKAALETLDTMPTDPDSASKGFVRIKKDMIAALEGKPVAADKVTPDVAAQPVDNNATAPSDQAKAKTEPQQAAETSLPSFDVLRVEKDGSTLIAGHAEPNAKVDILDGNTVIASTNAGDEGDFVAVLDDPLKPGDHQLVIRITGKDGRQSVSTEVATVSVPVDKSGQLLAMVSKPGEPSRIMEMPDSKPAAKQETAVARNTENKPVIETKTADQPTKATATETKTEQASTVKPDDTAKAETAKSADTAEPAETANAKELTKQAETAKAEEAKPAADIAKPVDTAKAAETAETAKAETATKPADISITQDTAKPAETAKVDTATKPADTAAADNGAKPSDTTEITEAAKPADTAETKNAAKMPEAAASQTETADVNADKTKPANSEVKVFSAAKTMTVPEVLVNAVEIEGDKIFVAGSARPKSVVRVYADDKLVAEVVTDPNGRFVADNRLPLTVGAHTIRADVLSMDGKRVEFRASVPFFRPEGEQLAAVNGDTAPAEVKPDTNQMQPLADGEYDKAREEAGKAIALLKGLYVSGRTPTLEELAAARSATEIALKTLSQIKIGADEDPMAKEMADKTAGKAAQALALLKSLPQDPNAVKTALNSIDAAVTSAVAPVMEVAASKKTVAAKENSDQATRPATTVTDQQAELAKPSESTQTADKATPKAKAVDKQSASTEARPVNQQSAKQSTEVAAVDQSQPKVIEQAPLKPSASASVIIRRGDTLWQISRRVYGLGVRYTTIYLANQDQIADPDRIMPGQIFGVPEKYLPNSEELHRERMDQRKH
jgi:nucleoid-associated protein YgaU